MTAPMHRVSPFETTLVASGGFSIPLTKDNMATRAVHRNSSFEARIQSVLQALIEVREEAIRRITPQQIWMLPYPITVLK